MKYDASVERSYRRTNAEVNDEWMRNYVCRGSIWCRLCMMSYNRLGDDTVVRRRLEDEVIKGLGLLSNRRCQATGLVVGRGKSTLIYKRLTAILWISTVADTWDRVAGPFENWAIWRYNEYENSANTGPILAGIHLRAFYNRDNNHQTPCDKYHNYHRSRSNAKTQHHSIFWLWSSL